MNKYIYTSLLLFSILSCNSDITIDNNPIIKRIDELPITETVYEVSIDNDENIIDTLSIKRIKKNSKGIIVCEITEFPNKFDGTIKKSYYRNNADLFFQEFIFNDKKYKIVYETFVDKNNIIKRAQMVNIEPNTSDTIFMKYNYNYKENGKKDKLTINSINDTINSISHIKYNDDEKYELKYQLIENDTIDKTRYQYKDGKLIQLIRETMFPIKIDISKYDKNEKLISNELFIEKNDDVIKASKSIYKYSNDNEIETVTTKDFQKDTIVKRKFLKAHNNVYN